MKEFSIISVIILNLILTARNFWLIKNQKTKSSLAMWLFFTIAVSLSLITYKSDGEFRYIDNILNTTDLLYVGISTLAILLYGDSSTKFNKFDITCLAGVILIFIFWITTKHHFISNLAIQFILIIAYFPVVNKGLHRGPVIQPC